MKQLFQNMSIKRKLMALTMSTSGAVLLLVTLAFMINETMVFHKAIRRELTSVANIIGMNSTAALTFNDNGSAEKTLEGLRSTPHILSASIMTPEGAVFAAYSAPGAATKRSWIWGNIEVTAPILLDNQLLGSVVVRSDSVELISRVNWFLIMVFFITLAALSVAYALSAKLQHPISDPILDLAHTVRTVSLEKDYSVRAKGQGNDEIGQLIKGFNEMLKEVQNRDMKLQVEIAERMRAEEETRTLNEELELKVEERTKRLVEAQKELVSSEKLALLGMIAGNMGNELRNPLGVMNNAVFFMKTVMPDADETIKEYLDIIKDEIDNSQRIISDLLDFYRISTFLIKLVPVHELVRQSLETIAVPENIRLQTDLPETLPSVKVDPLQMKRVLKNLVSNAVHAMPEGGVLRISARKAHGSQLMAHSNNEDSHELSAMSYQPDGDFIEISVTDTGTGIAPEHRDKLFQPLFSTKSRGIGLGLALSKKLTEANGGRIEVDTRLGKGTTFRVIVPVEGGQV